MSHGVVRRVVVFALLILTVSLARAADTDLSVNARLLASARNADAAGVERALRGGASADARNRLGETALLIALKKGDDAIARTMLAAGTDVNLAAVNGVTPLMAAAYGGQREMVEMLLARGAKPEDNACGPFRLDWVAPGLHPYAAPPKPTPPAG